ncbi:hypothetical protein FPE01S_05_00040 [Flavihumibacter petaseus NBRC 106054]|uniref:Uncharacterized protein n=1 Tax=Flavihumibacter petaseus NBRC 106054 TaxID=1220578 RepID=A0A0E9N5R9_9BACT|nr:hypothetical protein FPE01S_05_00040 [Flavihumibacter petaseus NBRC 106054]
MLLQYSNTALNIIFPLILFPYMTRTLGPSGYGVLGFYESMMLVVTVLAAFGVNYYGLRLLSKSAIGDTDQANTVLHLLLINGIMALLGVAIYFVYIALKPVHIGNWTISILYGYIMVIYLFNADWYFQSQEKYRFLLLRTLILRLFVLVSALVFVRQPAHLIYYIVISAINYSLIAVSTGWNLRHLLRHWHWDPALLRKLITALSPFAVMGILSSLYFAIDTILLARYGRITELGHYTVAVKIVRLSLNVFVAASIVFFVKLFRTRVDRSLQADSMLMTVHLSIPVSALLFFLAEPVIRFISGESYLPSVPLLQLFALLWVIVPLHDFFAIQVLMVHHKEKQLVIIYGFACVLSFVLNVMLIPLWFTQGAAIAIVLTEIFVLVATIWQSRSHFRFRWQHFGEVMGCLLCFPVAYGASSFAAGWSSQPVLQLIIVTIGTLVVYAGIQWYVLANPFWKRMIRSLTIEKETSRPV